MPADEIESIYDVAEKLERAAEHLVAAADVWGKESSEVRASDPNIIAITLLIRTLSNFRGALLLLKANRIVEGRTITRCCYENLFAIGALHEDGEKFIREMAEDHKASRKARGELLLQQTSALPEQEWQPKLQAFLAGLGKNQSKRRALDPKAVASRGPLYKGYVYYADLSANAAHPTLDSLERYLGRGIENDEPVRTIDIEPVVNPVERRMTLLMVCETLLGACIGVMEILKAYAVNDELAALMEEYAALEKLS
jgi:hypothetical protein